MHQTLRPCAASQMQLRPIVRGIDLRRRALTIAPSPFPMRDRTHNDEQHRMGDAIGKHGNALDVLLNYVVLLIVGQAVSIGVGLLLDPISKTAALATFIPMYYPMYWVAWRLALRVAGP